ncbi:hypothetical protein [Sphingomonas sp.]|uniref:hypothetical protein n=1 Tax=Sphingomonas sp. TaxID=28214 RepID=UPI003D6D58FA
MQRLAHPKFSRLSAVVSAVAVLITAQMGYAQQAGNGYEPPVYDDTEPHFEKKEEKFGQFSVVRNIEDYRSVPIMHGPWLTKESSLIWLDSTGTIGFTFVDNGGTVQFGAQGKSVDSKTTCIMQSVTVGYNPKPSTIESWEKIQSFIGRQLRSCKAIATADLNRAIVEMKGAGADYVSAANAWKGVSAELFGSNGNRCIALRMVQDPTSMPPRYECRKYSKP